MIVLNNRFFWPQMESPHSCHLCIRDNAILKLDLNAVLRNCFHCRLQEMLASWSRPFGNLAAGEDMQHIELSLVESVVS